MAELDSKEMLTYMATQFILEKKYETDFLDEGFHIFAIAQAEDKISKNITEDEMFHLVLKFFNPYLIIKQKLAITEAVNKDLPELYLEKLLNICDERLNKIPEKYDLMHALIMSDKTKYIEILLKKGLVLDNPEKKEKLCDTALTDANKTFFDLLRKYNQLDDKEIPVWLDKAIEELGYVSNPKEVERFNQFMMFFKNIETEKLYKKVDQACEEKSTSAHRLKI